MSSSNIAVLVHGTWGRGLIFRSGIAAWCQEGSLCRKAISRALGVQVQFAPFAWSGLNTPRARLNASQSFSAYLSHIRATNPHALIHVVAHSHGGNVVLYALRNPGVSAMVASVTCLSTPFLHIRSRSLGPLVWAQLRHGMLASAFGLFTWTAVIAVSGRGWEPVPIFAGVASVGFCLYLLDRLLSRLSGSEQYVAQFILPSRAAVSCPVLILRAPSDEASSALAAAQFFSNTLSRLLRIPSIIANLAGGDEVPERPRAMSRWRSALWEGRWVLGWAGTVLGAIVFIAGNWLQSNLALGVGLAACVGGAILFRLSFLLGVMLAPVSAVVVLLLSLSLIPFGPSLMLRALTVEISAEGTPAGKWDVYQLERTDESLQEQKELQHATHSNPYALRLMTEWLREKFRRR